MGHARGSCFIHIPAVPLHTEEQMEKNTSSVLDYIVSISSNKLIEGFYPFILCLEVISSSHQVS